MADWAAVLSASNTYGASSWSLKLNNACTCTCALQKSMNRPRCANHQWKNTGLFRHWEMDGSKPMLQMCADGHVVLEEGHGTSGPEEEVRACVQLGHRLKRRVERGCAFCAKRRPVVSEDVSAGVSRGGAWRVVLQIRAQLQRGPRGLHTW